MTWLVVGLLAAACFVVLVFAWRTPRSGREAIAAALLLGLAGYALQGRPDVAAAPRIADESMLGNAAAQVQERQNLTGSDGTGNSWVMIADALVRHGQYADAAMILRGAVEKNPNDAEAWLALANALVGHADGALSPAALLAYRHAAAADPAAPGPPFFLGLAFARSGHFEEAKGLWSALLARTPKDAPWRADLEQRLAQLNGMMQMASQMGPSR